MDDVFSWIGLTVFLIFLYFLSNSTFFNANEIIIYERSCKGYPLKEVASCDDANSNFNFTIYKTSFDTQIVVKRRRGLHSETLQNCSVYDVKNWECGNEMMSDGVHDQYFSDTDEYKSKYWEQISRWHYSYWYLTNFFGK